MSFVMHLTYPTCHTTIILWLVLVLNSKYKLQIRAICLLCRCTYNSLMPNTYYCLMSSTSRNLSSTRGQSFLTIFILLVYLAQQKNFNPFLKLLEANAQHVTHNIVQSSCYHSSPPPLSIPSSTYLSSVCMYSILSTVLYSTVKTTIYKKDVNDRLYIIFILL